MSEGVLNPVWLETFVTLIDTGHFTQTAEKLFMTQPGVSQHLNKLEEACGHALINRDKKSFVITEQGRLVYRYAKDLVKGEKRLFEQLNFDDPFSGSCTLACSGSVALLLYPKLLELQSQYPGIRVSVKAAPNQQILDDIRQGEVDQGIVTNIANENVFDSEELGKEELCLVFPQTANTSQSKSRLLIEMGLISHPDAEHYLSLYFKQCNDPELKQLDSNKIPVVGSVNQIGQILEPVAKGIGFTVIPKSALDSFYNRKLLKTLQSQKPVVERLFLVRKKNRELPARYDEFNLIIKQVWQ